MFNQRVFFITINAASRLDSLLMQLDYRYYQIPYTRFAKRVYGIWFH